MDLKLVSQTWPNCDRYNFCPPWWIFTESGLIALYLTNEEIPGLKSEIGLILAKIWTPLWTVIFGVVAANCWKHVDACNFCFPWPFFKFDSLICPSNRDEDFDVFRLIIGQVLMELSSRFCDFALLWQSENLELFFFPCNSFNSWCRLLILLRLSSSYQIGDCSKLDGRNRLWFDWDTAVGVLLLWLLQWGCLFGDSCCVVLKIRRKHVGFWKPSFLTVFERWLWSDHCTSVS